MAIGIAAGLAHIHGVQRGPTYAEDQKVPAPSYEWPPGCPKIAYRAQGRLAKTCTYRRRYRLTDYATLGLTLSKGEVWYRVGNDALLLDCQTWGRYCDIKRHVSGKFGR